MLFSIIIPIYNSGTTCIDAIKSIQNQSYHDMIELILIDDNSTDDSVNLIESYLINIDTSNISLLFIKLDKNEGPGGARNHGLINATGQYICFLDSDDSYLHDYLNISSELISQHNADMLIFKRISRKNNIEIPQKINIDNIFLQYQKEKTYKITNWEYLLQQRIFLNAGGSVIIKKEFTSGIQFSLERNLEDWLFFLKIIHLKKPNALYFDKGMILHDDTSNQSISRKNLNDLPDLPELINYLYNYSQEKDDWKDLKKKIISIWIYNSIKRLNYKYKLLFIHKYFYLIVNNFVFNKYTFGTIVSIFGIKL